MEIRLTIMGSTDYPPEEDVIAAALIEDPTLANELRMGA